MDLFSVFRAKFPAHPGPKWYARHVDRAVVIKSEKLDRAANYVIANAIRYQAVEEKTRVPWALVGAIHWVHTEGDFRRNMSNGDTIKSQDQFGKGPWKDWESCMCEKLDPAIGVTWTFERLLYYAERILGMEYYEQKLLSPSIWGATSESISKQPGVFALLDVISVKTGKTWPRES